MINTNINTDNTNNASLNPNHTSGAGVIRIGGVPEHFNLPWRLAIESGDLAAATGVQWVWSDVDRGTGALMKQLDSKELDIAVCLPEGAIAHIAKGLDADAKKAAQGASSVTGPNKQGSAIVSNVPRLVGTHVSSALTWGVHVAGPKGAAADQGAKFAAAAAAAAAAATAAAAAAGDDPLAASLAGELAALTPLRGANFGISRPGSGSHLMSCVMGRSLGWDMTKDPDANGDDTTTATNNNNNNNNNNSINSKDASFSVVDNMPGAAKAVNDPLQPAQAFLWNLSTTQPLVDDGTFRRVGAYDSPWPAFVVAARAGLLETADQAALIAVALDVVKAAADKVRDPARFPPGTPSPPAAVAMVAGRYGLREDTTARWMRNVEWVSTPRISAAMVHRVLEALVDVGIITQAMKERVDPVSRAAGAAAGSKAAGAAANMTSALVSEAVTGGLVDSLVGGSVGGAAGKSGREAAVAPAFVRSKL